MDQQARLSWHRVREDYKKDALAAMNRMRGLLAEFGIVINKSAVALDRTLARGEAYDPEAWLKHPMVQRG